MSQDTSDEHLATLQESRDFFDGALDRALGGPDSRLSRIFKAMTDEELTTLLVAGWNRDDRGLEAEAFTIWDAKMREHK